MMKIKKRNKMKVRAKFKVDYIQQETWGTEVSMRPVTDGSKENKAFWEATPAGILKMTITNEEAAQQFMQDEEYYVDFIKVKG